MLQWMDEMCRVAAVDGELYTIVLLPRLLQKGLDSEKRADFFGSADSPDSTGLFFWQEQQVRTE